MIMEIFSKDEKGISNEWGAYRNSKHIHVITRRVVSKPEPVDGRSDGHGDGVVDLRHDEGETDGVPVRDPSPILLGNPVALQSYSMSA